LFTVVEEIRQSYNFNPASCNANEAVFNKWVKRYPLYSMTSKLSSIVDLGYSLAIIKSCKVVLRSFWNFLISLFSSIWELRKVIMD